MRHGAQLLHHTSRRFGACTTQKLFLSLITYILFYSYLFYCHHCHLLFWTSSFSRIFALYRTYFWGMVEHSYFSHCTRFCDMVGQPHSFHCTHSFCDIVEYSYISHCTRFCSQHGTLLGYIHIKQASLFMQRINTMNFLHSKKMQLPCSVMILYH